MKGLTHLTAGALTAAVILDGSSPEVLLTATAFAATGSLLPDIDIATSKIAKLCRPAALGIQLIFGHRGIFHSLLLWIVLCYWWYLAIPAHLMFIQAVALGILSHLILDTLNPSGVPLFWPIPKRISIAPIRSGGILDILLGLILTAMLIYKLLPVVQQLIGL